jgi:hypothetical protein
MQNLGAGIYFRSDSTNNWNIGGANIMSLSSAGNLTASGNVQGYQVTGTNSVIAGSSLTLDSNGSGSNFTSFGGAAINLRTDGVIRARNQSNSAYQSFEAGAITASGLNVTGAITTSGGTDWKIGQWGPMEMSWRCPIYWSTGTASSANETMLHRIAAESTNSKGLGVSSSTGEAKWRAYGLTDRNIYNPNGNNSNWIDIGHDGTNGYILTGGIGSRSGGILNINSSAVAVSSVLRPTINNTHDLGGPGTNWNHLYLGGTIQIQGTQFIDGSRNVTAGAISATSPNASTIALTVKGAASQTANLQEWQNTNGTTLSVVNSSGNIGAKISNPARPLHISQAMRLEPLSGSQPASASMGDLYSDGNTGTLCYYDGSSWVAVAGGTMTCN